MLEQDRNAEGGFTIIGSYGYMPFEQYEGRAFPASDIYALGMTLIFLLTGREPSDLDRDEMRLVVPEDASITPAFREALGRMIEPDVEKRFQSVDDVDRALPVETAAGEPRISAAATAGFAALLALLVVALVIVFDAPTGEPATAGVSNARTKVVESTRSRASAATAAVEPGGPMQYEAGWKSFEPVPPDPGRSKLVAQGLITYAGQPFGMKVSATPQLKVWSEAARDHVVAPMRYENGEVEIFDLEPGLYRVWATWWDGANRYDGGQEVRVEASRVVQFEFHMNRSIEIAAIAGAERREGSCELVSVSPVVIAWKPFEDGTIFDYDVYESRCDNKGRGVPLSSGSTKQLSLTLSLPPNKPGMRYQINLGARRSGTWVGTGGMMFAVGEATGL